MNTNLKALMGKLNATCRSAMESAAGFCLARSHYEIDIEHLLAKLIELEGTDIGIILSHYGIVPAEFEQDIHHVLRRFKTGNTRNPVLSTRLPTLLSSAWLIASVDCNEQHIRSGHILLSILSDTQLRQQMGQWSDEVAVLSVDDLQKQFDVITVASKEARFIASPQYGEDAAHAPNRASKTSALDQYAVNLTEQARLGHIDPVLGRDSEVRQMIDILMRRRQNNPILTGEAGVGKTAVVEGLALRIVARQVPTALQNVQIHMLDLGLLQAGASVKGEFENRLKTVIEEVKSSLTPIILFIDEAHTMIGAGGQAGQNDAANLLKPALARGELRTIAATTWSEYKKYFEKDPALTRRFQVVKINEPNEEQGIVMLRGLLEKMQRHHKVRVLDEALIAAVRLSNRYITGRQLPDKAVSVLDTACASIALGIGAVPPLVEDAQRHLDALVAEIEVLQKEEVAGQCHDARITDLRVQKDNAQSQLISLEQRWQSERTCVVLIHDLQNKLEALSSGADEQPQRALLLAELAQLNTSLSELQGKAALVQVCVDEQMIAAVVSSWTGIPLGKMLQDELTAVSKLQHTLAERIIGQDHALEAIAQRIRISRAGLEDPSKPIGVFMLVGPSGVGKTETALALADALYGGERNLITINMSEFQEAHTVSSLKGSPPGYVGYGEGGVLTEAVRRKPYSVVLLDEVEKAHPDVLELFFQVFDKGVMDDAEGREVNFKNTIILLTSNIGTNTVMRACSQATPSVDVLNEQLRDELNRTFKPAFIGRMQIVPYYPVKDEVLKQIVRLKLQRIKKRLFAHHNAHFDCPEVLVDAIAARCTEVDSGARNIDNIISGSLLPGIAQGILDRIANAQPISLISAALNSENQSFVYTVA